MAKDFDCMADSNRSSNADIHSVSDPARRVWIRGGLAALVGGALAPLAAGCATAPDVRSLLGFKGVAASTADRIVVPAGYVATTIAAWGEPVGVPGRMPAWREDASSSAADQAVQMGMHHDGIHFYPLAGSSTRGLLAMNHEYVDDGLLHAGGMAAAAPSGAGPLLGFKGIVASTADTLVVPEGYVATAIAAWGEPIGVPGNMPPWREDAASSAAEQAVQMGMHHDGIHFYALGGSGTRGLLTMNHEYTDDGLLHADGMKTWSAEKVKKAQAAHGVSVIEVERQGDGWAMVRPSAYARRFTANTPFALGGPAAGHALMQTAADPAGRTVLGTLNNCASGKTPWGTYLSGEENFIFYFALGEAAPSAHQKRWGLRKTAFFRWNEHDECFDAAKHLNEYNRFGWVVEIDPMDAASTPIKRTALGKRRA